MTSEELKTEIADARARGIPAAHLAAVSPHFARLHPGDVEGIASYLVKHFPHAVDGDPGLAINAERAVARLDRPAPPAQAQTPALCDWPPRPVLPPPPNPFARGASDPPSIPERFARFVEGQELLRQAGWAGWGTKKVR
jgi:hypothetical protein